MLANCNGFSSVNPWLTRCSTEIQQMLRRPPKGPGRIQAQSDAEEGENLQVRIYEIYHNIVSMVVRRRSGGEEHICESAGRKALAICRVTELGGGGI